MKRQTIKIALPKGEIREVKAAVYCDGCFGMHGEFRYGKVSRQFTALTHLPTGYAIIRGTKYKSQLMQGLERLEKTLSPKQVDDIKHFGLKDSKNKKHPTLKLLANIAKYLGTLTLLDPEIEKMVGAFHGDRWQAEKIRLSLNPEGSRDLLDSEAIANPDCIAEMMRCCRG